MKRILLIGCGHMGYALFVSWIKSKKYSLTTIDPIKSNYFKKKYKNYDVNFLSSYSGIDKLGKFDFIVLATKPKDLPNALNQLQKINYDKHTSIISIVAGKKINIIQKKFKETKNIFRVMPNMPAIVGESMNCIVRSKHINNNKIKDVIKLFSFSGETIVLKNENQIDMATAVSGSGPGFVFNLVDALEKAAIGLGFNKNIAKILVNQTFKGSIQLLIKNNLSAKELVKTVATKGGTTEAGLKIMKINKIHKVFSIVAKEAYKKAKMQGK